MQVQRAGAGVMQLEYSKGFADRDAAAGRLVDALAAYRGSHPLVLAIPRGGVPIGRVVADALGGELDVILVRKLGAPGHAELAIGAIDETGRVELSPHAGRTGAGPAYVQGEAQRQLALIRARRASYSPGRSPVDPAGRTVIVVDDGLATGATMRAALGAVRAQHPGRLVCAVPVAAPDSLARLHDLADDVVCVLAPRRFRAVGQFYDRFEPVDDARVIALLAAERNGHATAGPPGGPDESRRAVSVPAGHLLLPGDLTLPAQPAGLVIFAHGSGSSRHSPRNRMVAEVLHTHGIGTLLFDLLTPAEDVERARRFDIATLRDRLLAALDWTRAQSELAHLPLGLFGASTGAAAALAVAAARSTDVAAVVSRGGRPDLAGAAVLERVQAPSLLLVGSADVAVIGLNRSALAHLHGASRLEIIPGAGHLFEEPGTLERVAARAASWFGHWMATQPVRGGPATADLSTAPTGPAGEVAGGTAARSAPGTSSDAHWRAPPWPRTPAGHHSRR